MPRVSTQKANKDYPELGIKKGDTYYKWKFRYSGVIRSATMPKPSQLTQSDYLSRLYGIQEDAETTPDFDDIESQIEDIKGQLEELRDEQEEKKNNMPEQLQESSSGELLQERCDCLDGVISDLDSIDVSGDFDSIKESDEAALSEAKTQRAEEIWSEVTSALSNAS